MKDMLIWLFFASIYIPLMIIAAIVESILDFIFPVYEKELPDKVWLGEDGLYHYSTEQIIWTRRWLGGNYGSSSFYFTRDDLDAEKLKVRPQRLGIRNLDSK